MPPAWQADSLPSETKVQHIKSSVMFNSTDTLIFVKYMLLMSFANILLKFASRITEYPPLLY